MIKIVLLLLLFLVYASRQREGLRNYLPIIKEDKIYGINVIRDNPGHIYEKLTKKPSGNPEDPDYLNLEHDDYLYQERFIQYPKSDIILDMQYFNNASYLISRVNR